MTTIAEFIKVLQDYPPYADIVVSVAKRDYINFTITRDTVFSDIHCDEHITYDDDACVLLLGKT